MKKYIVFFIIVILVLLALVNKVGQNSIRNDEQRLVSITEEKQLEAIPSYSNDNVFDVGLVGFPDVFTMQKTNSKNLNEYISEDSIYKFYYNEEKTELIYVGVISMTIYGVIKPDNLKEKDSQLWLKIQNGKVSLPKINISKFITNKGLYLGISKDELIKILGKPSYKKNENEYCYEINDYDNSVILKEYHLPQYLGIYKFKDNELIEFSFGFYT